ncbi:hypothetical protein ACFPER_03400 [Agromyces aurantiacus]|uniref:DUF4190 domain-containing protein n=1 Tax=Agromyces aurantiacus TaxID=165814 RepID=A0ABV9R2K2_9MICO|nr:hypothetical protein [Agromyces aurantiacus]MBM7506139.1 hypothetical protein [Agromyces aurantiacus]
MTTDSGLRRYDEHVGLPFDPLRLCVFATIALLTCVFGPLSLLVFSVIAIRGYARARRAGLLQSRCKLGDTRNVLAYLVVLVVLAVAAVPLWVGMWMSLLTHGIG